ncbi:hypothetical protein C0J52_12266 [Blattella germanica]|nr:hypothetical protein C0J52_12266 [Blattella germanica]
MQENEDASNGDYEEWSKHFHTGADDSDNEEDMYVAEENFFYKDTDEGVAVQYQDECSKARNTVFSGSILFNGMLSEIFKSDFGVMFYSVDDQFDSTYRGTIFNTFIVVSNGHMCCSSVGVQSRQFTSKLDCMGISTYGTKIKNLFFVMPWRNDVIAEDNLLGAKDVWNSSCDTFLVPPSAVLTDQLLCATNLPVEILTSKQLTTLGKFHVVEYPKKYLEEIPPPMRLECITISLDNLKQHKKSIFNVHNKILSDLKKTPFMNLCDASFPDFLLMFEHFKLFRCILNLDKSARNIARDSSNTSGTEETPFFERATHKYCLIAVTNISFALNTGPAF